MPHGTPSKTTAALARRLGLRIGSVEDLSIARHRRGRGWSFVSGTGAIIRDRALVGRLNKLAVPPAYSDVKYATDPASHLQAVGRDAAGRLQYRYHPDWTKVREVRKARRLARLAESLPRIRRSLGQHLAGDEPTRELALAAVIELVACSAIRPGSENHARLRGTRGAATLLKSNVSVDDTEIALTFRAKGGKRMKKSLTCPRLARPLTMLRDLRGSRMFQYRDASGDIRHVTAQEVNAFLRDIAGIKISLKDFRTLLASAHALERLAQVSPAPSARGRKKQILDTMRETADALGNTPAICRKSYVHDAVVSAFEDGVLSRFADRMKSCRSVTGRAQMLAEVLASADAA